MKRLLALALVTLSGARGALAQDALPAGDIQPQGARAEQAVRELSDALKAAAVEATADTTQAKPGRLRFTYEVDRRDDCRLRFTQKARLWKAETRLISEADLSSLSPDIDIWTSPGDGLVIVTAYTTSGRPEVSERFRGTGDDTEYHRDGVRFRGWNRESAERIATPLATAIRACGGRPQDAAARVLVANRMDSLAAERARAVAARADSARAMRARVPGPGRWVRDSTPPVANRRQVWWAAVAANDTLLGRYKATRPVLQLNCASDTKRVQVIVLLGQAAALSVNTESRGAKRYRVQRAAIMLGRDEEPVRVVGWLHDFKNDRVGPDEGKQLDEVLADVVAARRYRFGVRLFDMKEPSYTAFELDSVAEHLAWLRERCGAKS